MEPQATNPASGNFDRALRHLAELSAISRLSDYKSSVQELVLQAITVGDTYSLKNVADIKDAIDAFFGIPMDGSILAEAVEFLIGGDRIRVNFGAYALSDQEQQFRSSQIAQSRDLETAVYENWHKQLIGDNALAGVDFEQLKKCMADYMGRAFRQHGIETAQILDAGSELAKVETESLVHVLNETVNRHFTGKSSEATVKLLISQFFRTTDKFSERRKYLIELADGAYSFYTFFIDPEVSSRLRETLRKIDFYLDTNFLWGLLGLHQNQYVDASVELFGVARAHHLPFFFRYHKVTEQELLRSVASSSAGLRQKAWKASISATLRKSPYISGIERKFHEKNAEKSTDVDMFLKPYENISRIVQDQDIKIDNQEVEWGNSVNELLHEFSDYLEHIEKEKTYEAMQHDVRMLWLVRSKRSNSKSPLQAGTLFLTCDNRLYNFDIQNSRRHGVWPSTILPNVLLQILRPSIQTADDFDTLFVKTFSLPEFRSYSKKSSLAVQKMAEILSALDGLPPAVAEQMLMDDILVKDVSRAGSDAEISEKINGALVGRIGGFEKELSNAKSELTRLREDTDSIKKAAKEHADQDAERLEKETRFRERSERELQLETARRTQSDLERDQVRQTAEATARSLVRTKKMLLLCLDALASGVICWGLWRLHLLDKPKTISLVFLATFCAIAAGIFRKFEAWAIGLLVIAGAFLAVLLT
jgi:hypothetical protein